MSPPIYQEHKLVKHKRGSLQTTYSWFKPWCVICFQILGNSLKVKIIGFFLLFSLLSWGSEIKTESLKLVSSSVSRLGHCLPVFCVTHVICALQFLVSPGGSSYLEFVSFMPLFRRERNLDLLVGTSR